VSNHHITGQFELSDNDLRYICTAAYAVLPDGPKCVDLTLLHIAQTAYELPADDGFDPEPLILNCQYVYQQIELEKRLREDFEPDIQEVIAVHAAANAGAE
jgi:hypothetical protein